MGLCYLIVQALPVTNSLLDKTVRQAVSYQLSSRPSLSAKTIFIPKAMNYLLQNNLN